ncbi:MAG: hypothetical protein ACK5SL_08795, partial [Cyclobacteriaceae bacterium]
MDTFFYFPKKEGQQFAHCLPFLFQYKACLFAEGVQSQPRSKNGLQFTVCFICRQVFCGCITFIRKLSVSLFQRHLWAFYNP